MPGTISYVFASGGDPFSGRGRLNFPDPWVSVERDATNPLEVDVVIAAGSGATLQIAYDGGEAIVTDAQGSVDLSRGAATPDGEAALSITDANLNPGRSVALLDVSDQNVVAIVTPNVPTMRVTKDNLTASEVLVRLQTTDPGGVGVGVESFHDTASPANTDVVFRLTASGRDGGGTYTPYARVDVRSSDITAGAADGSLDLILRRGGVLSRAAQITAVTGAAESGFIIQSALAAGAVVPFTFWATSNFVAGQFVFRVLNDAGGTVLTTVDGVGTVDTLLSYEVAGTQVVSARGAAVADAAGGAVIDVEARAAINALLARVRTHGLIAP